MQVSVQLHQVTSVQDGPAYRVKSEVLSAVGMQPEVFVYKTATQVFDHYATVADMELYPQTLQEAQLAALPFYRQASVQRDWPTASLMQSDLDMTQARVQDLVIQMASLEQNVVVDQTLTISSGS